MFVTCGLPNSLRPKQNHVAQLPWAHVVHVEYVALLPLLLQ
jgi:hypothetical protein